MSDFTTIAVDPETREAIRQLQHLRGDSNTRETVRFLVENVEIREYKSHDGTDVSVGVIAEEI